MATKQATLTGIMLESEPVHGGSMCFARVLAKFPAYTSATDTAQIGGNSTAQLWGAASDTLATLISKMRRDGKTVTIASAMRGEAGTMAGTLAYAAGGTTSITVSSGNLTMNLTNLAGTDTTFSASTNDDLPIEVIVSYSLS